MIEFVCTLGIVIVLQFSTLSINIQKDLSLEYVAMSPMCDLFT